MAPSASDRSGFGMIRSGIEFLAGAQAGAIGAGAVRAVEGKGARLDLGQADAAIGAGQILRIEILFSLADGATDRHAHHAVAQLERRLHRIGQARAIGAVSALWRTTRRSTTASMVCIL